MTRIASTYDVVVAGGGSAGVAAAIGAARCGARTLLIERYGFLGGAATSSNVLSYCGFYKQAERAEAIVGGVASDLLLMLAELGQNTQPRYSRTGNWILAFDPEVQKLALDRLVTRPNLDLALHAFVVGATTKQDRIHSLTIADHDGLHEIRASGFVDATGESDLARRSGLRPIALRDGASELQTASFPVRLGGVPAGIVLDRNMLRDVADECLAEQPSLPIRKQGGVCWQLPQSGDFLWMGIDFAVDGAEHASLTKAEIIGRQTANAWINILRRREPFAATYIVASGPQVGIRETPHVAAVAMASREAAITGRKAKDGIARAGWPMEVHAEAGNPRYTPIGGDGWFDVPYGAICAAGLDNLWLAGRTIGSDAEAYGSIRVMGTAFATGHAAGIAAAVDLQRRGDISTIRSELLAQGALI